MRLKPSTSAFLCAFVVIVANGQNDYCGDLNADTLELTLIVFRHGDRSPYQTYPTDPYQEEYWDQKYGGFGQLTPTGEEQHFVFGEWFRKCYSSFLMRDDNTTYNPKALYVKSTDYDRTLKSAAAHLAAVYPPEGDEIWNDNELGQLWQPIPIHTVAKTEDYILKTDITCPPYQAKIADMWANSPQIKKIQEDNQELLNYIAKNAGLKLPGDLNDVTENVCDAVNVELIHNLTLPTWINETVQEKLKDWDDIWIDVELANDEMIKWAGGELVYELGDTLKNKSDGKKGKMKHMIWSAHDTTVGTLLAAYGDFDRMGPPYRSAVITELHHKKKSGWWVKAFYRNDTTSDPYPLQIRDCPDPCMIDDFIKALQVVTIPNKQIACNTPTTSGDLDEGAIIAIAVTSSVVVILILLTVIFLMTPICRSKLHDDDLD